MLPLTSEPECVRRDRPGALLPMSADGLSQSETRRIALAAQGFDRPRPNGPVNAHHLRHTIRQLGLLQIDYVNVLAPAHYQVLFSRLGPYERSLFDDLVYRRREFTEQWAHEASIVPVETWPLLRHRMTGFARTASSGLWNSTQGTCWCWTRCARAVP